MDRIRELKEKHVQGIFPAAERGLLKRRLEEMAYVFFRLEEMELARISLAAARGLETSETLLMTNPVCQFLLERGLRIYGEVFDGMEAEEGSAEPASPRIILP